MKAGMRFPGIRSVEQTEKKISRTITEKTSRIRDCLKEKETKRVSVIVGLFYSRSTDQKRLYHSLNPKL